MFLPRRGSQGDGTLQILTQKNIVWRPCICWVSAFSKPGTIPFFLEHLAILIGFLASLLPNVNFVLTHYTVQCNLMTP